MSKVLADCEVIYILVFLGQAKMAKASYFEGGMLAAIKMELPTYAREWLMMAGASLSNSSTECKATKECMQTKAATLETLRRRRCLCIAQPTKTRLHGRLEAVVRIQGNTNRATTRARP